MAFDRNNLTDGEQEALRRIDYVRFTQVSTLNLSGLNLLHIPNEVFTLKQLERLSFASNSIQDVPSEVRYLNRLNTLNLHNNQLHYLPSELGQLHNLQILDLSDNELIAIPSELRNLQQLEILKIQKNCLSRLPPELGQLQSLRILDLSDNQLVTIPAELGYLQQLNTLELQKNCLSCLPPELGQLHNLQTLNLDSNCLTFIPYELGALEKLQLLNLRNNQIALLPPALGQLKQLQWLGLSDNQLFSLPSELRYLEQLHWIDLSRNKLQSLPFEFWSLYALQWLYIHDNPLALPHELTTDPGNPTPLLVYLRELALQQQQAMPLNEAKLILIGEGAVGKTSLVQRLLYDTFDPRSSKTNGIAVERWSVPVDEQSIDLNIWDFGGQEIMHATHRLFMTRRSLYVVVIDARSGERASRLEYWLRLVQSVAPDAPVLVVSNKVDEHPADLDQARWRRDYSQIVGFAATSCATGDGITELREQISVQLRHIPHIHDELPHSWAAVKQALDTHTDEYLAYDSYLSLCREHHVTDPDSQRTLLGLLHDLGTSLYFSDALTLAETAVLKPSWITSAIYAIINYEPILNQSKGILDVDMLPRILDKQRYPRHKHGFILALMQRFEMCVPLDAQRWLLPDLLPLSAPPEADPERAEWHDALCFVYQYPVLPSSVMVRFLVRAYMPQQPPVYWRSGCILYLDGCRVLVSANSDKARIDVYVAGEPRRRRTILGMVRHWFAMINASFSGLADEIKELIPLPGYPEHLVSYADLLADEADGEQEYKYRRLRFRIAELLNGYSTPAERAQSDADDLIAEREQLQELIRIKREHLRHLEQQRVGFGELYVPPYVVTQIKELIRDIAELEQQILSRSQDSLGPG